MAFQCPMHPEVVQVGPGRCPVCGMRLLEQEMDADGHAVQVGDHAMHAGMDHGAGEEATTWRSYLPLIVVILLLAAATAVLSLADARHHAFSPKASARYFMAGFFLVFAGFKLVDLRGFADGYATYDLLARKWGGYGFVYPFIELGFGLMMLAGQDPKWLLWAEVAVMAFSGIGVAIKLAKGERFQCSCLGTFLKVPLTKVTLVEDFGMAALALYLLFS